jgi:hypothetical protein
VGCYLSESAGRGWRILPDNATSLVAIGLSAPPEPFVLEEHRFKHRHALMVVGFGSPEDHASVIAPVMAWPDQWHALEKRLAFDSRVSMCT